MFDVNPTALKFHHADLERAVQNARNPRQPRRQANNGATVIVIVALIGLIIAVPAMYPVIGA